VSADSLNEAAVAYRVEECQSPFAPLIDQLYREEVEDARKMSGEEKLLAGQQLFEYACEITLAGIRHQNPGISEEQCRVILRERLAWRRRMEQLELVQ
jgi:hypothetical protein